MNLREISEKNEEKTLSSYAVLSRLTKGRKKQQELCTIRTEFQRDRDRIIHSKSFRRLMHKTQVFISPEQDHFRTRLTHTLEVSQVARTISRALNLNEDLTEAIALGHDLGHTPFGHQGENVLNKLNPKGFKHNEQSIVVVELLENDGEGLNLTEEVLDGILNHKTSSTPKTLEGKIVRISDKIAYTNHDIDDSIRAGILKQEDLPKEFTNILGKTSSERIEFLIFNIVNNSINKNNIILDEEANYGLYGLRKFMFETVYLSQLQLKEQSKIEHVLEDLYFYYLKNIDELPKEFLELLNKNITKHDLVSYYIAGMTDRFALKTFDKLFVPSSFKI